MSGLNRGPRQPPRPGASATGAAAAAYGCSRCFGYGSGGGSGKLALLDALVDDDGEIAASGVDDRNQTLRGRLNQEEELREELFLARQGGERLDLVDGDDLAVDDAQLEGELRVVLDPGGERLGQRDRIARGIGDGRDALEALQRGLDLGALRGARGQLVLDDVVAAAGPANGLAQVEVLRRGEAGKVPIMAEVECSSSLASAATFSVFFALVNAITKSSSLSLAQLLAYAGQNGGTC